MRGITGKTEVADGVQMAALVLINDGSADQLLLNTSPRSITHGGKTYLAGDFILGLGDVRESVDLLNPTLDITLAGASGEIRRIFAGNVAGWTVDITKVWLDDEWDVVGNYLWWQGSLTGYSFPQSSDEAEIMLHTSTRFQNYRVSNGRLCNNQSNQRKFPDDTGFRFAAGVSRDLRWGEK